jgi:hypothetical protein
MEPSERLLMQEPQGLALAPIMNARRGLMMTACLFTLAASACNKDDIRTYIPPKAVEVDNQPDLGDGPRERMLAAMIPFGRAVWYLKLQGPEKDVTAHKQDFDLVLQSFRLHEAGDKPASWTTPPGWRQESGAGGMQYAVLTLEARGAPLEITVTRLEGTPNSVNVTLNVDRWRKQLGLHPVSGADIPKVTRQVKLPDATAVCIDFTGVAQEASRVGKAAKPAPPPARATQQAEAAPLKFTKPDAWTVLPDQGGPFRALASFEAVEGNKQARITITSLAGEAGGLNANIVRWREQLGLTKAAPGETERDVKDIVVDGLPGQFVDLTALSPSGPQQQRMLVAVVPQGSRTWFFKMLGAAELVGKQKSIFETFMQSVRFEGGPHG